MLHAVADLSDLLARGEHTIRLNCWLAGHASGRRAGEGGRNRMESGVESAWRSASGPGALVERLGVNRGDDFSELE